jgi:hypothetical protein
MLSQLRTILLTLVVVLECAVAKQRDTDMCVLRIPAAPRILVASLMPVRLPLSFVQSTTQQYRLLSIRISFISIYFLRRINRGSPTVMTAPANSASSDLFVYSVDPHLRRSFSRRFPTTRESYGRSKEQQVLAAVSRSTDWQRVGKPYFRRDVVTGIVFRRAPASRLLPAGRITVCVPYEVAFHVAVRIMDLRDLSLPHIYS